MAIRPLLFVFGCALMIAASGAEAKSPAPLSPQVQELLKAVRGKRVAFVTNATGVAPDLTQLADIVDRDPNTTLVAVFGPEHGFRGDVQAGGKVTDYIDPYTSVPVYSLYGSRKAPEDAQLSGTDVMVFDIQDAGTRFYTFIWTMTHAMESAARNKVSFIVYDRPNPLNATDVEGVPNSTDAGLIGRKWEKAPFGVPTRYGLTIGELATLVNEEWMDPKVDLKVIKIPDYKRRQFFDETGQPWVIPSPNMPTPETALVYPGMCIFEGTNISEGRGMTRPFETVGAPFLNGVKLAETLNALNLPGVRFRPAMFTPTFSKFKGEQCSGVQVHVMDRKSFRSVATGLHVLKAIYEQAPKQLMFRNSLGRLSGDLKLSERITTESVDDILKSWEPALKQFKAIRAKYLLY